MLNQNQNHDFFLSSYSAPQQHQKNKVDKSKSKSKSKLTPCLKNQAAYRLLSPYEKGTQKSVCKRFGLTKQELNKAVKDFEKGKFVKTKSWNPSWNNPDCIHHVLDTSVVVDIEGGSNKGSDLDLLMDPNFDPINGFLHVNWSEDDINTLCASLPYRILEIIRDSVPNDPLFIEAVEFGKSDLFNIICQHFGIDAEELMKGALEIAFKNSLAESVQKNAN